MSCVRTCCVISTAGSAARQPLRPPCPDAAPLAPRRLTKALSTGSGAVTRASAGAGPLSPYASGADKQTRALLIAASTPLRSTVPAFVVFGMGFQVCAGCVEVVIEIKI